MYDAPILGSHPQAPAALQNQMGHRAQELLSGPVTGAPVCSSPAAAAAAVDMVVVFAAAAAAAAVVCAIVGVDLQTSSKHPNIGVD
eukprot:366430-Chlamydomonas_euryale.AAC.15